jgi:hypothetical protein
LLKLQWLTCPYFFRANWAFFQVLAPPLAYLHPPRLVVAAFLISTLFNSTPTAQALRRASRH